MLRNHSGMGEPHMKRAVEWFLPIHEMTLDRAYDLIPTSTPVPVVHEETGTVDWPTPNYYVTNTTAE